MVISVPVEIAEKSRRSHDIDGQIYTGQEYIGSAPKPDSPEYGTNASGEAYPQGYLVTQPPGSVTRPHFHQTNQFQVFVSGSGQVGKHRTDPITVQYAGGNTPYGPIVAEEQGIAYFTLRQCWDSGAKYLPGKRDLLVKGRQRQRLGHVQASDRRGEPEILIAEEDDGLLALNYRLAPGQSVTTPDGGHAGGQYHVVTAGALNRDGTILNPLSIEFAFPDDGAATLTADKAGADVLVLRFPKVTDNA